MEQTVSGVAQQTGIIGVCERQRKNIELDSVFDKGWKMELKIDGLSKSYGSKQALKGISCAFQEGVYGILGANGAGKSTLMNIITGNITADGGQVLMDGKNIFARREREKFRGMLGYMPQYPVIYRGFTVSDFLFYMAALRGVPQKEAAERINGLLEALELSDAAHVKMTALSGGMRQRMMLAQAVLGDPKVLILDEPTAGLDPKQRIAVRNLIAEIAFDKIVLIATHVVTDVEFISREILLLREGEIVQKAEREALIDEMSGMVYEIQADCSELKRIQERYLVGNIIKERERVFVRVISDSRPAEEDVSPVRPSLEDVYLYHFRE